MMSCATGSHDLRDDDSINRYCDVNYCTFYCMFSYSVITALRHSHLTHPQHLRELTVQVMRDHLNNGSAVMTG